MGVWGGACACAVIDSIALLHSVPLLARLCLVHLPRHQPAHPHPHALSVTPLMLVAVVAARMHAVLKGHFSAVTALSLSPDGWTLVSGGRDSVAIAWNLRDHTKIATVPVFEALEGACVRA